MARSITLIPNQEPFILDGLLEIPDLVSEPRSIWQPFQQASNLHALELALIEKKEEPLPELHGGFFASNSGDDKSIGLDSFAGSTSSSEIGEAAVDDGLARDVDKYDDVWSWEDVIDGNREYKLVNWDAFMNPRAEKPRSAYLSEAGPTVFDAVLSIDASYAGTELPKAVAQHEDFLRSLFELGMGRNSLLYHYDQVLGKFVPATENYGLSSISFEIQRDVLQDVLQMGNYMRQLEAFVGEAKTNALSIALSSAISAVLYAVKVKLQTSKGKIQSILQVKELFSRSMCLLQSLQHLIKISTTTNSSGDIIIKLTDESEKQSSHHTWLAPLLHEILTRVSAPWISAIEAKVGLRPDATASDVETAVLSESTDAQEQTSDSSPETRLTPIVQLVTESKCCLDILRAQQPDHPVPNSSSKSSSPLSWQVSWEAISRIQMQANEYEQALLSAVLKYSRGAPIKVHHPTDTANDDALLNNEDAPVLTNLDAPNVLDRDLGGHPSLIESRLFQRTTAILTANTESPDSLAQSELRPLLSQSLSLSLTPFLNAQSRLLSFSTLHLIFKTHSLRNHLSVQHRFQLLTDGSFASRLSRALFDPDQSTGEGRRRTEGTAGLRLQARGTWPPASSELRLVLIGILSESYQLDDSRGSSSDDLPGDLSFAIRDLSAEELERCRDVSRVEALDFLRLQYKAPAVLDSVITKSSLKKYDKIFKFMLRLLRMQAVARSLLRDVAGRNGRVDNRSQRFRIHIQQFIGTLGAYSNTNAIGGGWSRFQKHLKNTEAAIDSGDYEGTIAIAGSLSRLGRLHEGILDGIITALFLSRRQAQARDVIDSIFGLILQFAATSRRTTDEEQTNSVREMYTEFKRQVGRLMRYLSGQDSASLPRPDRSDDNGLHTDSEPPFEHLLLALDTFGYFTKSKPRIS
jgi:Gamma tubulin complex component C-terminal/Gamma tubulin complex component N-terminal